MSEQTREKKQPCTECGMAYDNCVQFWTHSRKCCKGCNHPTPNAEPKEDQP